MVVYFSTPEIRDTDIAIAHVTQLKSLTIHSLSLQAGCSEREVDHSGETGGVH